jgi:hypothetical protein
MNDDPLLKDFAFRVSGEIKDKSGFIIDGKCQSFEHYKQMTGIISGLRLSLEIMGESAKNYLSNDEGD